MTTRTPAQIKAAIRQDDVRVRRLMLGLSEVRGIYLEPSLHAEVKAFAAKLAKKKGKP